MDTQPNWRQRFKNSFVPWSEENRQSVKFILPFLILVTLVLGWLYTLVLRDTPTLAEPAVVAFTVLLVVHLALYWLMIFFAASRSRSFMYIFVQGVLIFVMVVLTRSDTLAMGLYTSMIGNAVGMLGKQKASLFATAYFLVLAAISLTLVAVSPQLSSMLNVLLPVAAFTVFFAYFFNQQIEARMQMQALLDELAQAHQQLAEYTLQVEDLTLAGERQRMARELHDTLAQGLAGLILQLEAVVIHIEGGDTAKAHQIVEQAMSKARATLVDARRVIDDLRTGLEDPLALQQGIAHEVERFQTSTGIPCKMDVSLPDHLDTKLAEHILRTVTEGLWNIARHAQASGASLQISAQNDQILLSIEDDGVGFDPEDKLSGGGHYGLLGIRERARLAGGSFKVTSAPGEGTQLRVSLPNKPEEA